MFSLTAVAKSSFRPIGKLMAVSAIIVAALSAGSTVSSAAVFQFILHDHPDGALANPTYGLRLDDLYGGNNRYFTFSFDAPGTGMTLLYDDQANTVRIVGRARGGIDVGGSYDPNNLGFVDIDFTYQSNLVTDGFGTFGQDSTNLGLKTTDHDQNVATGNSGTITLATSVWGAGASEGDVFTMVDQSNGNFSFKLNNFSDHRLSGHPGYGGPDTFVGWGWVNHWAQGGPPRPHVYASDWLFTAELVTSTTEVPAPAGALIFAMGAGGLAWIRRRKRKSS